MRMREFEVITAEGRSQKIKANYVTFRDDGQLIFTNDKPTKWFQTSAYCLVHAYNKNEWKSVKCLITV